MFKLFKTKSFNTDLHKKPFKDGELKRLDRELKEQIKEKFSSSLKLYILDTGSCNGCELEIQALFNPLYDISKIGIEVTYDIAKADILFITGLLTENMYLEAEQIYKKLKEPKRVITVGDCPLFHAPFRETFALRGHVNLYFESEINIVGCPPEPRALLRVLLKYLKGL